MSKYQFHHSGQETIKYAKLRYDTVEGENGLRARNNGRSTINDRQEIVFDRRRSNVAVHLDRQEIYLTIV